MEGEQGVHTPTPAPRHWWPHLAALALILAEACWVTAFFRMVQPGRETIPAGLAFVVLGLGMSSAYAVAALCEALSLLAGVQRAVGVVVFGLGLAGAANVLLGASPAALASGLLRLRPEVVLLLLTWIWLWRQGSLLGSEAIRPATAWRRFVIGLFLFLATVFIHTRLVSVLKIPPPGLGLFAGFLFFSLAGMALARIGYVSIRHGARKNPFDRRWLAGLLVTAAGLVTLAMTLGSLLTGQYRLLLDQAANAVSWLVIVIFYVASLPWLALTYLLGPLGRLLGAMLPERATPTPEPGEAYPVPVGPLRLPDEEIAPISPEVQALIFWAIMLALAAGLFLARARRRQSREPGDQVERLLQPGSGWRLFKKGLRDQLGQAGGLLAALRPHPRPALRVRQIYAGLLELCQRLNRPRRPYQTPQEFLADAGQLLPERIADLDLLTGAYQKVRYGELPETSEQIEALEEAWRRIQADARLAKRARQDEMQMADLDDVRKTVQ